MRALEHVMSGIKKRKETASASAATQLARGSNSEPGKGKHSDKWDRCVKDVKAKGSAANAYAVCTSSTEARKPMKLVGRIREATAPPAPNAAAGSAGQIEAPGRRFRVVLLREGMGNLVDCYYYTKDAIESCPPIFEGKKFFIDHADLEEEELRPERSITDVGGWFENLSTQVAEDGCTELAGDLVTLADSPKIDMNGVRALLMESIAYSQSHAGDLVGLSIAAGGDFDTISLEQFVRTENIPAGCQAKIAEATAKGISMIRPVRRMTSATSCDLVTEAGAGGRISQLLERNKMSKETKETKETKTKEDGAAPVAQDGAADGKGGGSKDHADADQDKELIKSMLSKYVGDGFTEEDHAMASEAYQAALEAHGGDEKEAMETAGRVMKMAKFGQAKQAKKAAADAQAGGGQAGSDGSDGSGGPAAESGSDAGQQNRGMVPGGNKPAGADAPKDQTTVESVKEANKKLEDQVVKLTGENVALKAKLEERELTDFIDGKLRESRLPNSATKKFREAIKGVKSQKEVSDKLAIFQEAYLQGSGEAGDGVGLFIQPEKAVAEAGEAKFSAADCLDT